MSEHDRQDALSGAHVVAASNGHTPQGPGREESMFEGRALVIAGYQSGDDLASTAQPRDGDREALLARLGAQLLAGAGAWQVARLSPRAAERQQPSRAGLKRHIDAFAGASTGVLVLSGSLAMSRDSPVLITAPDWHSYPEDTTLPLSWIGRALRSMDTLLVVLCGTLVVGRCAGEALLDALDTGRPGHVIAVHTGSSALLRATMAGIGGAALDSDTGTITGRSIGRYLRDKVPLATVRCSESEKTLLCPPPLAGLAMSRRFSHHDLTGTASLEPAGSPENLAGVVLPGRFKVGRELSRGSFGVVYLARQLTVDRDVAVKVLRPEFHPASDVGQYFLREIHHVGRLDHPNIVRIFHADATASGCLFLAMELVRGRDLRTLLDSDEAMTAERATSIAIQLLHGLDAAHSAGILHCDLKPANIMLADAPAGSPHRQRVVLLDFGLSRLHIPGQALDSEAGTPAYMAPEQLQYGRVDERSDVFAVGLILCEMLTGWRRQDWDELSPPLESLDIPGHLRPHLTTALAVEPERRFAGARAFADALSGKQSNHAQQPALRKPFRFLAAFTAADEQRFFGRERAVSELVEHALFDRGVIYTAPSGTGKTSLLQAGLLPGLHALGVRTVHRICRGDVARSLVASLWPDARDINDALRRWSAHNRERLVVVLDQVETLFLEPGDIAPGELVRAVLNTTIEQHDTGAEICVILCVREDFLARLVDLCPCLGRGVSVVRLGPLSRAGAGQAIMGPLSEHRVVVAADALDRLLDDLVAAGARLAPQMGWKTGHEQAVYPPHLQLACSVLYDSLEPGEAVLTLEHYRRAGGLDTILGEHLDQVLDRELDGELARAARTLFFELATSMHTRRARAESELVRALGREHEDEVITRVLEILRARGLIVPVRAAGDEPGWELVHDSLVPRVLAWADRRDLARQQAKELLRYHLHRSTASRPSLLGRGELSDVRAHAEVIAEIDQELSLQEPSLQERLHGGEDQRDAREAVARPGHMTARALVAASRAALRRRWAVLAGLVIVAAVLSSGMGYRAWREHDLRMQERAGERALRAGNIGRFVLVLDPFDWDPDTLRKAPVPPAQLPALDWGLYNPDPDERASPGTRLAADQLRRPGARTKAGPGVTSLAIQVEARGGPAFLRVSGRGRGRTECPPSWIQLAWLPGYAERDVDPPRELRVAVPTCAASRAGTVEVPAGPFVHAGPGIPPSAHPAYVTPEEIIDMPGFRMDRTEVSNAAYAVYARMSALTGHRMPAYPPAGMSRGADAPRRPVALIDWYEARAFCRFMGKRLPSNLQWEKAARGGLYLDAAKRRANPHPRRNLPWGIEHNPSWANLAGDGDAYQGTAPVGSFAAGASPYGLLDMAGNVQEWTRSTPDGFLADSRNRVVRGGSMSLAPEYEAHTIAYENRRDERFVTFDMGVRCVEEPAALGYGR